ncbi:hypothetical protein [Fibrobacter sp. UWR1]|uniref:hypothetical protein n=1 Tax=Fibrobacter sp. UWR1 TaxID=2135645 RepID=UPI000DACFB7A|nr:hypothetical protein [Fibrobacter sp. UWR1]PZW63746.1 hypothetical protein C8E88_104126 [Fibrobacter sp. UWR1]
MSDNSFKETLEIIEVPPELRGPSDEEILKMSEKVLREVKGKRKKGERRPSKRRRAELKTERALQEAQNVARNFFAFKETNYDIITQGFNSFTTSTNFALSASSPRRVLKASFGSKLIEKPKAVIVSAAELAKQRAEEKARKIREALMAKKNGIQEITEKVRHHQHVWKHLGSLAR